ncbi:MAG: DUF1836 domain-containing protein [Lachnospiraceae bacterium]
MEPQENITKKLGEEIADFHLPRYQEIPEVGLFLDQIVRLINSYLEPLGKLELTPSMVSNYVKHKLIEPPVKKQYQRDQIAYLIFMAMAKTVLSLEEIRRLFELQKESYTSEVAYNYLCEEFENVLQYTFGNKDSLEEVGVTHTQIKTLLRIMIVTMANKIYLDKFLDAI